MARHKSPHLTESELPIMQVLWNNGAQTVAEVVEALPRDPAPAYSTVLTTMRILEQKGYVRHSKAGRAFVYAPVVDRHEASRDALRFVVSRFFTGSATEMIQNLIDGDEMSAKELVRLKKLIADAEKGEKAR